jgi:hypothetical protein
MVSSKRERLPVVSYLAFRLNGLDLSNERRLASGHIASPVRKESLPQHRAILPLGQGIEHYIFRLVHGSHRTNSAPRIQVRPVMFMGFLNS